MRLIAVSAIIALLNGAAFGSPPAPAKPLKQIRMASTPVLDLIGNRSDKNSVGHGRNVALYTGRPSRFFFATHELGPVFDAVNGKTVLWYPDHVLVDPTVLDNTGSIVEQRQVCVTRDDVVVSQIRLHNTTEQPVTHRVEVSGDCRNSHDWRDTSGGRKVTSRDGDVVLMFDYNVFPEYLPNGLCFTIGANVKPVRIDTDTPGTYRLSYNIELRAGDTRRMILACAIDPDERRARRNIRRVLQQTDPVAENRRDWRDFYAQQIPRFTCSDRSLNEFYGFRWFLLRFSTAGGDLGHFKYPVVLEGRQAYQTYCCYSAPFMAFDMNWAVDPGVGFGHIASMVNAAYDDGRFPWYTSPRTNRINIHHRSGTGLSLLPFAAARHHLIHGDERILHEVYPGLNKNVEWWIRDRDSNGDGLFDIDHPMETGMDDLVRWGGEYNGMRYDAVDASCYAYLNMLAVAQLARARGDHDDAERFTAYARKTAQAVNMLLWSADQHAWFDRDPQTHEPATHYLNITTFYPFFVGMAQTRHLDAVREHLLNPVRFWLPYPVPALPKDHPEFNPNGFWRGPSWPAATSHVVEALASAAKELDRSLLPQAAALLRRAAYVHLQPRPDFYERYNPLTGRGLSKFRDYMHSWWIDIIIRHVVGLEPRDNGTIVIDPLPLDLEYFALLGAPLRGHAIDVLWCDPAVKNDHPGFAVGLSVAIDGRTVVREQAFRPGNKPVRLSIR